MTTNDQKLMVLRGLLRGDSFRTMMKDLYLKSPNSITLICEELELDGYVENPYNPSTKRGRRKAGRRVTEKGIRELEKWNLYPQS